MRKLLMILLTMVLCTVFGGHIVLETSAATIIPNQNDICTIRIQSQSPMVTEHETYNFSTTKFCEIVYITHFLNSLEAIESNVVIPSDGKSFLVGIEYVDGSNFSFSMYSRGISIDRNLGYNISTQNYIRFLDFIYALKTEKVVLPDDVTFEPSEWAKSDVEQAIKDDLVPKLNQINYTGKISRLEVCQLVDNYLKNSGYADNGVEENPFSDTSDGSIITLYRLKIIDGKSENLFYPYDLITREEFAKILANTYHHIKSETALDNNKNSYKDQDKISDWAIDSVNEMTSLGMFRGNEIEEFQPQNNITKEEVIVTLLRMDSIEN